MGRPRTRIVSIGDTFGRLEILKELSSSGSHRYYICKCICGKEVKLSLAALWSGNTKSCGCYKKEFEKTSKVTHGMSNTPLHAVWNTMKQRCSNENADGYKNYGGRGISVCEEWKTDYLAFYNWATKNGYKKGLTIERVNVDGDYEPLNCKWIPFKDQSVNRRSNHYLTYDGKTKTLSQWARDLSMKRGTLKDRIRSGWSTEKALTEPVKNKEMELV